MKYNLFIGRFQSPHKGHMFIFDRYIKNNLPVLIAIRDVETDAANPLSANIIMSLWETIYRDNPLVKVIVIPDIESVNYGRSVGYDVNEILADENIMNISASEIRRQILNDEQEWMSFVDPIIHTMLKKVLKTQNEH